MEQILRICCFCEKVHDGARTEAGEGLWQEKKISTVSHGLRPLNTILAYSCCSDCLTDEPHAIAFRSRRSQSGASIRATGNHRIEGLPSHLA
jgi:hypothetical protein